MFCFVYLKVKLSLFISIERFAIVIYHLHMSQRFLAQVFRELCQVIIFYYFWTSMIQNLSQLNLQKAFCFSLHFQFSARRYTFIEFFFEFFKKYIYICLYLYLLLHQLNSFGIFLELSCLKLNRVYVTNIDINRQCQ